MHCIAAVKISDKWLPRTARRLRKPLKNDWKKQSRRPIWLKCTYERCAHEWTYSGIGNWARCPSCGNYTRVAVAKKQYEKKTNI